MVEEQELEVAVAELSDLLGGGPDNHPRRHPGGTGRLHFWSALDFNQTHPANSDGLQFLVGAVDRNVDPGLLAGVPDQGSGLDLDGASIHLHCD